MIVQLRVKALLCVLMTSAAISASFPINIIRPYDLNFRWEPQPAWTWQIGAVGETALNIKGVNEFGNNADVLRIWAPNQNGLAMVQGFPADSQIGQVAASLSSAVDDGVRGHMVPSADLAISDMTLAARYFLPFNFSLGVYLPIYFMNLSDVSWRDLTQAATADDLLVRDVLTNNFTQNVYNWSSEFGCKALNIQKGWSKNGPGDLTVLLNWSRNYPQQKPWLNNVRLGLRLGATIPTSVESKTDALFSIPFGNDGAWGTLFGAGIELEWCNWLRGGIQADFWNILSSVKNRRIKTDTLQTDLVLLANVKTLKDWGFTRRYTIYLETVECAGVSVAFGYQFYRASDSKLTVLSNDFSSGTADTSVALEDWTIHNLVGMISTNVSRRFCPGKPRFSVFFKIPFNGRRSIFARTIGASLSVSF